MLREAVALASEDRIKGGRALRDWVVHRLYFAGFKVIEDIGTFDDETVPYIIGVKGTGGATERAALLSITVRSRAIPIGPGPRQTTGGVLDVDLDAGTVTMPGAHSGLVSLVSVLHALDRLRDGDLTRPLVVLVSYDEATRGSGILSLRLRYGLDISRALISHPSAGRMVLSTPGAMILEARLTSPTPEWRVASLENCVELNIDNSAAEANAAETLLRLLRSPGSRGFELAVLRPEAHGHDLSAPRQASAVVIGADLDGLAGEGVSTRSLKPESVSYPFCREFVAVDALQRAIRREYPEAQVAGIRSEETTLILTTRVPFSGAEDATLSELEQLSDALGVALEDCARAALRPYDDLDAEIDLRLYRVPFPGPSGRAKDWFAEKWEGLRGRERLGEDGEAESPWRALSMQPSEGAFTGTRDVILLGPEDLDGLLGAEDSIAIERVSEAALMTARLLTRLVG